MGKLGLTSRYKYKLKLFRLHVAERIEFHDLLFHHDCRVLLPGPPQPPSPEEVSGIRVVSAAFDYAQEHPKKLALIAGHTDTSGSDSYNVKLSGKRARNVYDLVSVNKSEWVKGAHGDNKSIDWHHILKWLSTQGWSCDPGAHECDPDRAVPIQPDKPQVKGAVKAFQAEYNRRFAQSIKEDGIVGKQTWEAFFDCYIDALGAFLDETADTPAKRAAAVDQRKQDLKYLQGGKEFVGCGESFPREAVGQDHLRSQTNRRVELLFFNEDEKDQVTLDCHPGSDQCKKKKCLIYQSGTFHIRTIPVPPVPVKKQLLRIVALGFDFGKKKDQPLSHRPWQLLAPAAKTGKTDAKGLLELPITSEDQEARLAVDLRDAQPEPAPDPEVSGSPTAYPIKIKPSDWVDKNAGPVLRPSADDVVNWKLALFDLDATDDDEGIKARLHNLGFACDRGSEAEPTRRAVKAYQALYLNQKDGSGTIADVKDDVKKRHDRP